MMEIITKKQLSDRYTLKWRNGHSTHKSKKQLFQYYLNKILIGLKRPKPNIRKKSSWHTLCYTLCAVWNSSIGIVIVPWMKHLSRSGYISINWITYICGYVSFVHNERHTTHCISFRNSNDNHLRTFVASSSKCRLPL